MEDLAAGGLNTCEIARATGIPRSTVHHWRANHRHEIQLCRTCGARRPGDAEIPFEAYAYLFGLYLGDGYIARHPKDVFRLDVALDARYPRIIAECRAAVRLVMPNSRCATVKRPGCLIVTSYSRHWPCLFPQHGPGHKHEREIVLAAWQRDVVRAYPQALLRGLIHSDGSRHLNTVHSPAGRAYAYPRYEFSNRSDDIRRIFTHACDLLGIQWRPTNRWNISVARRESVARMDEFVGPKR